MSTVTAVVTKIPKAPVTAYHVLWETLVGTDDGSAVELVPYSDRSVQVIGTFDTTTVIMEGSNDGSTWTALDDPQGAAITGTAAYLVAIGPLTRFVRPRITADGGSGNIDVHMIVGGPIQ